MSEVVYWKYALTGGSGTSVDGINGNQLNDGDVCFATIAGTLYPYLLNASSGQAENAPYVICPDTNAGNKRWILQGCSYSPTRLGIEASDTTNQIGGSLAGIHITNTDAGNQGRVSEIAFGGRYQAYKPFAAVSALLYSNTAGNQSGHLVFSTKVTDDDTYPLERMRIRHDGMVGIGTNAPSTCLGIEASDATTQIGGSISGIHITNQDVSGTGRLTEITFGGRYQSYKPFAAISGLLLSNNAGNQSGHLVFSTKINDSDAYPIERMRITEAGKVGIGMTPTYTLDVTGNFRCSTGFGCNNATPQTPYASGGALAAYGAGTYGFDSAAHASALYAMVVAIRAALVADGIMS